MTDSAPREGEPDPPRPLLPDDWRTLSPLVDAVLDAPPERREAVLDAVSAGDAARRAAIARLVAECETGAPMLDRPAAERFAGLVLDEDGTTLPETLGGRYGIQRELGRGGMARVYLARDTKHARAVAVKVIRPDLAASLGRDRFLREIAIAARLRHPNIVPLYDSGDADGLLYFVMPYEDGPSLRQRLDRGTPMTVPECVSALRDVARALAYAHDQGVVHRDVKPDNVMMSGGAAVVADFGIAKAVAASVTRLDDAGSGATEITQLGATLGTPAYMAPEQAVGDPSTDHRADIYAFGCLAYELFAGHPPFHGLPAHQVIAAHMSTAPVPLAQLRPDVPDAVGRLVGRCLEKLPSARPQTAHDLLAVLDGSDTSSSERRSRRPRSIAFRIGVPIVVAALGAIAFLAARNREPSPAPVDGAVTLAVLPLDPRGITDSTMTDMADALSDEVATSLVGVPGVRIMSRSTVSRYRGARAIVPQRVGRDLGARVLLMGALRGDPRRFTITVSLVDVTDATDLWARVYERNDGDFSAARDEIAAAIEQALRTRFGRTVGTRVAGRPAHPVSPQAYLLYASGLNKLRQRGQRLRASIDFFRQATRVDTLYANAYAGLSVALALAPYFEGTPAPVVAPEAIAAARRALSLDSTLAQPHVALGLVYQHAYDWKRAGAELETAMRLRTSDDAETLVQYGRYLMHTGRVDEAMRQFLEARKIEPTSALVSSYIARVYDMRGQPDSALAEAIFAFQNDSTNLTTLQENAVIQQRAGHVAQAQRYARALGFQPPALFVLAATGDTAEAMARLRAFERVKGRWMANTFRAYTMLGMGDTLAALDALERATDAHEIWPSLGGPVEPTFDSIRGTERYKVLARRVGLPPDLRSSYGTPWPR
jgi:eukaryotic-like serine/threonine-protein kinase